MRRLIALFLLFVSLGLVLSLSPVTFAQTPEGGSSGIAVYIPVVDKDVKEGSIVVLSNSGYVLGTKPYDPNIFGVVVADPALAFESNQPDSYPVVSQGKVPLLVSGTNGDIKKGDLITTSTIPGVGQKVTDAGFVVATALEDYSGSEIGTILVVLNVGAGSVSANTTGSILKAFDFVLNAPYLAPLAVLRYVFAAIMVVLSFVVAVGYFGRISSLGIEAIGRNPLARKAIIFGVVMNIVLALSIVASGVIIAWLVLVV